MEKARPSKIVTFKLSRGLRLLNGKYHFADMVDQTRSEQSRDYTLADSDDSAESTIHVATSVPKSMRLRKKRKIVASESNNEESTVAPDNMSSDRDESEDEMGGNTSSQAPGLADDSATASGPPITHVDNGGDHYDSQRIWNVNISLIQGLVELVDKDGREEMQRHLNTKQKLSNTQRDLSKTQQELSNERQGHSEAKSEIKELARQVAEYKHSKESLEKDAKASQARGARLESDENLRQDFDCETKRLREMVRWKHETVDLELEQLKSITTMPEEAARLRKTIDEQNRELARLQTALNERDETLQQMRGLLQ
ncbi:hypothetical protein PG994_012877 [Apiospora phragmitis]|uniref:Uncharacterized protein n=1 Tax=Apiospora phragmitis TaxID=2905665 RepID=A0ABR1T988_9PEZI